jgi:hypothetical protein
MGEAPGEADQPDGHEHHRQAPRGKQRQQQRGVGGDGEGRRVGQGRGEAHQMRTDAQGTQDQPQDHPKDAKQRRHVAQQQEIAEPAVDLPHGWCGGGATIVVAVVNVIVVLGLDVRNRREEENDGQNQDGHRHAGVRNPQRRCARAVTRGVFAVEEHAGGNRAKDPTHTVTRLGRVDARGGVAGRPEHRGIGISHRFQERQAGGHDAHAEQEGPKGGDLGGRDKPKAAHRNQQQPGDDAALVAQPCRQPARRQRHHEVTHPVRELHPGRLGKAQVQFLLKELVHHVNHPVAEPPEEEQRADEAEGEQHVPAVRQDEHALLGGCLCGLGRTDQVALLGGIHCVL